MFFWSGTPYQLDQLAAENCNQAKLSTFFTLQNNEAPTSGNLSVDDCDNRLLINKDEDRASLEQQVEKFNVKQTQVLPLKIDMSEEPSCSVESSCEVRGLEQSNSPPLDRENCDLENNSSSCKASVSPCSNRPDDQSSHETSSSRMCLLTNQGHSTLSDPNFVENYFKVNVMLFCFDLNAFDYGPRVNM